MPPIVIERHRPQFIFVESEALDLVALPGAQVVVNGLAKELRASFSSRSLSLLVQIQKVRARNLI